MISINNSRIYSDSRLNRISFKTLPIPLAVYPVVTKMNVGYNRVQPGLWELPGTLAKNCAIGSSASTLLLLSVGKQEWAHQGLQHPVLSAIM